MLIIVFLKLFLDSGEAMAWRLGQHSFSIPGTAFVFRHRGVKGPETKEADLNTWIQCSYTDGPKFQTDWLPGLFSLVAGTSISGPMFSAIWKKSTCCRENEWVAHWEQQERKRKRRITAPVSAPRSSLMLTMTTPCYKWANILYYFYYSDSRWIYVTYNHTYSTWTYI